MAKPIQYCKVKKKKKKEVHEENQEAVEAEWEKLWTPIEGHGHQLPNFHFIRKWECGHVFWRVFTLENQDFSRGIKTNFKSL